jgi:hypothetical protein
MNKTKSWSFEKINEIEKSLTNLTKMRREKTQISKIRNKKGEITTNNKDTQGIFRDYCKNLYSNKLEYLEEMDKFLDTYDYAKLNQKDINHLNRSIINVMKLKQQYSPIIEKSYLTFSVEFYQNFKEELILTLPKLFHKIEREGTLLNSFYEASITLNPKSDKDTSKKENYRPIFLMYIDAKILNKIMANQIQQHIRKIVYHDQVGFIPGIQGWFNISKSLNVIQQRQKPLDISIDTEKAFNKIQHHFVIKALRN